MLKAILIVLFLTIPVQAATLKLTTITQNTNTTTTTICERQCWYEGAPLWKPSAVPCSSSFPLCPDYANTEVKVYIFVESVLRYDLQTVIKILQEVNK